MNDIIARAAPSAGLAGGLLIGLPSAIVRLGLRRIAGVSGFVWNAFAGSSRSRQRPPALAFLTGLPLGASLIFHTNGSIGWHMQLPASTLVVAGLLVGFGTRMGSGCSSGHGVCGIARLSPRSIVATGVFMAAGFATVAVLKMWGLP